MKLTIEAPAGQTYTIPEIIDTLNLGGLCNIKTNDPCIFRIEGYKGKGTFDIRTGEYEYDGKTRYIYEERFGAGSLAEALDKTCIVWGKDEEGYTVAYFE